MGMNHNIFSVTEIGLESEHENNRKLIKILYKSLLRGETDVASKLVAPDLEWWYHGPPHCNHMMRILTGESTRQGIDDHCFKFRPRRIVAIDRDPDRVIVEGWEGLKVYWVHVWTVNDGIITQFREYFDTWLTVIVRVGDDENSIRLWQTDPRQRLSRSLPDVVIAI